MWAYLVVDDGTVSDTDDVGNVADTGGDEEDDDSVADVDVDALEDEVGTVETGRTNVLVSSSVCVWLVLSPILPSTTTVEVSNTVSVSISTAGAVSTCVVLSATCA